MAEGHNDAKDALNLVVGVFGLARRTARFARPTNIASGWISRLVTAIDFNVDIPSAANFFQLVSRHPHLTAPLGFGSNRSTCLGWAFVGTGTNL